MSCSETLAPRGATRRGLLVLLAGAGLSGCGFRPLHGDSGAGAALRGKVSLREAASPEDFAYRERLRRRLGDSEGAAPYRLDWRLEIVENDVAVRRDSVITRFQLLGRVTYRMTDGDRIVAEDQINTMGGYDATASVFATQAARRDERARLVTELAELTATRLFAFAPDEGA